jgi:UDP-N-acetylglucosamine 2-epimerase (hydrolysing)
MTSRKLLFVSGTRADFGKVKPLITSVTGLACFELDVFVTGMHMLSEYGSTHTEFDSFSCNVFKFVNHLPGDADHTILSKTLNGLGDTVSQGEYDLIIVHGDRLEALAGATVGVMSNTLVAHVEGGELSGTVDDSYRHAISKLAHHHFVANEDARQRLLQLGEDEATIHVIGSPELDLMHSGSLPKLSEVLDWYEIPFSTYGIAIFHPVVTERERSIEYAEAFSAALEQSGLNWVLIESNNDQGSDGIRHILAKLSKQQRFRVLPSMRYHYFLTLLKNATLIAGNSSVGVRESPHYGVPSVNVGSRQRGRTGSQMVVHTYNDEVSILNGIKKALEVKRIPDQRFGDGKSAQRFSEIIRDSSFFERDIQKVFNERRVG